MTNPNVVFVGMSSDFAATPDPKYGNIGGYAVVDITNASPAPPSGTVIDQTVAGAPITSQNTIQFENVELPGLNLNHSAAGFIGNAFPHKPYAFPSPQASPLGTMISNTAAWSTGLVGSPSQGPCFSQEFTLQAGTYYFGDLTYYNITTAQDVLVVATP